MGASALESFNSKIKGALGEQNLRAPTLLLLEENLPRVLYIGT